jgi:predicted GIY-YIG superfamily endonuclease
MAINGEMAIPPEMLAEVERYAVYRCYSDGGQLLYVGVTGRVGRRLGDHIQKAWFTQVRGMTFEWYMEELDALNAERRIIQVEHPKYNIVHRNTPTPRRTTSGHRKARRVPAKAAARPLEEIRAQARAILNGEPDVNGAELARRTGMSERWGQAYKKQWAGLASAASDQVR